MVTTLFEEKEHWKDIEGILGILVGDERLPPRLLNLYPPVTIWLLSFWYGWCFSIGDLLNFPTNLTYHYHQEGWFKNCSLKLMVCLQLISFWSEGAME